MQDMVEPVIFVVCSRARISWGCSTTQILVLSRGSLLQMEQMSVSETFRQTEQSLVRCLT